MSKYPETIALLLMLAAAPARAQTAPAPDAGAPAGAAPDAATPEVSGAAAPAPAKAAVAAGGAPAPDAAAAKPAGSEAPATAAPRAATAAPAAAAPAAVQGAAVAAARRLPLGRTALPEEVAAWNTDVSPDGTGLPDGSGSVKDGEQLFIDNCASCHGEFAEGLDRWPSLAGGEGTLNQKDPVKTVGSYWPYLSTVWDYAHHSMPFGNARILSPDDAYAVTAYILYSNSLVDEDFVLSKETFAEVRMPNADGFIVDDRPGTEYPRFSQEPCMKDCKDRVEITMHASVVDVTPNDSAEAPAGAAGVDGAPAAPAAATADPKPADGAAAQANAAEPAAAPASAAPAAAAPAAPK